jgi:hypothetical protein
LWEKQAFSHDLISTRQSVVRVHYPGYRNNDKGPDYKNAIIEIDNNKYKGDVEIHLNASDWFKHNHQGNKDYCQLVLHVVWNNDLEEDIKIDNKFVPTIELKKFILVNELKEDRGNRACFALGAMQSIVLNYTLKELGYKRFFSKVNKFDTNKNNGSELLTAIASVLGAPNNCKMMESVCTYIIDNTVKYTMKASNLFLEDIVEYFDIANNNDKKWNKFRIRPNHSITNRIAYLIELYDHWDRKKIMVSGQLQLEGIGSYKIFFTDLLTSNTRYDLGKNMKQVVIYNCLLPYCWHLTRTREDKKELVKLKEFLNNFQKLENNRVRKIMLTNLSDYQIANIPPKEIYYQGLHYLFNYYCKNKECTLCQEEVKRILR